MTLREENLADIVLEEFEIRRTDLESKDEIELGGSASKLDGHQEKFGLGLRSGIQML